MEIVFQNESDVVDFIHENVKETSWDYDSVAEYLKTLPEKTWKALLFAYENVIREELQSLIAEALTEEELD